MKYLKLFENNKNITIYYHYSNDWNTSYLTLVYVNGVLTYNDSDINSYDLLEFATALSVDCNMIMLSKLEHALIESDIPETLDELQTKLEANKMNLL